MRMAAPAISKGRLEQLMAGVRPDPKQSSANGAVESQHLGVKSASEAPAALQDMRQQG